MDAIIQIKQMIDALESGAGKEEAGKLNGLLANFGNGLNPQDSAATIVKMMQSINKYLIAKSGTPHPDAVPLLASLGSTLETMAGPPSMNAAETKNVLDQSIREFKSLKAAISTAPSVSQSEFESLKAVILSVDWEISNLTLKNFDKVISQLKEKVKSNKVHFTFLRIMHSLGGYVARNGSNANNDSITLLQSVFQDYESLFLNPDMPLAEKKSLIEGNIQKYKEFKSGLASSVQAAPVSPKPDEEMSPALSHLGSSAVDEEGEATLSVLSDAPKADEEIFPALSGKENTQEQPRDVMGDLFSPKTTPADELLDAIHLAELHGPDQQAPAGMMPPDSAQQEGEGVKNYTPERGRNEPIPEIASRLDEFFNLDVSEDSLSDLETEEAEPPAMAVEDAPPLAMVEDDEGDEDIQPGLSGLIQPDSEPEPAFGTDGGVMMLEDDEGGDDSFESLVPALDFTSEDEEETGDDLPIEMIPEDGVEFLEPEVPELDPDLLVESLEDDDPAEPVLVRLKNLLNAPAGLADDGIYTQALEDIDALDQMWAPDQNKDMLLEMLSGIAKYVHESAGDAAISVPAADAAGEEYAAADDDGFPENIELDEDEVQDAFSVEGEETVEEDVPSPGQTDPDGLSAESEIEEKPREDAVSFDDDFQPEEVDSPAKSKSGFFGRLMAKFRK